MLNSEQHFDGRIPPDLRLTFQNKDKTYYFCSELCKHLFERVPEKYIKAEKT
ncbi:MAG: YHS domain-containing protein [Chloroflexi bacterium]|nr:YHS domain-containing protein [Chloroflexota bacterium]